MPAILSGNTLGLKFMQRGAAAKAATEARKQEEAKKQAELQKHAAVKHAQSSDEDEDDSSDEEDSSESERERAAPVASTSKLPARHQPPITTESSYLAFPILSSAYGVASVSEGTISVNGRFTFGEQPQKKKKHRQPKGDDLGSDKDDVNDGERDNKSGGTEKKDKKIHSISSGGSGYTSKPSTIREQQRARTSTNASGRKEESAMSTSEAGSTETDIKYEEDTTFVDDMMQQARQKRQLDGSHNGRKKKRKSAA